MVGDVAAYIAVEKVPGSLRKFFKRKLTVTNPHYQSAMRHGTVAEENIAIAPTLTLYKRRGDTLFLPRGISATLLKKLKGVPLGRKWSTAPCSFPDALMKLTPLQEQMIKTVLDDVGSDKPKRPFNTYLCCLPVSSGKTIAAAMLAKRLGQRTLIIVHRAMIERGWIKDLKKCLGLKRSEIGRIKAGEWRLGKQFTIATFQTLHRRQDRWPELFRQFGTLIVDEVQVCPSATFIDCANACSAKYRIGITGTPQRADGLHTLMYRIFGTPFFTVPDALGETETSMPVNDVFVRYTETKMPARHRVARCIRGRWMSLEVESDPHDFMQAINTITKDAVRTKLIARDVARSLEKGHSCLITSCRVQHLKDLAKEIRKLTKIPGDVIVGATKEGERDAIDARLRKRELRWLCITLQIVKVGVSINPIDRLYMTTPISYHGDVKQLTGRIRRKFATREWTKKNVKVFDYVDKHIDICYRQHKQRIGAYRELGIPRFRNVFIA